MHAGIAITVYTSTTFCSTSNSRLGVLGYFSVRITEMSFTRDYTVSDWYLYVAHICPVFARICNVYYCVESGRVVH